MQHPARIGPGAACVVDRRERGKRSRQNSEQSLHIFCFAETNPAAANRLRQCFKIEPYLIRHRNQPKHAALVYQEQVLGMGAHYMLRMLTAFLDSEYRRMFMHLINDTERGQIGVEPRLGIAHNLNRASGKRCRAYCHRDHANRRRNFCPGRWGGGQAGLRRTRH